MNCRRASRAVFLAASIGLAFSQQSKAALIVSLRLTGVTGSAAIDDYRTVSNVRPGDKVFFDVVAAVTGGNGTSSDDGLTSVSGSLVSWSQYWDGAALGTMHVVRDPSFMAAGSADGQHLDVDGDGDLDVGGSTDHNPAGFFIARWNLAPMPAIGSGFKIGSGFFELAALTSATGTAELMFAPRVHNTAAIWREDNETRTPADGWFYGGDRILVNAVPEPSMLLALGAVAGFASALRPRRVA